MPLGVYPFWLIAFVYLVQTVYRLYGSIAFGAYMKTGEPEVLYAYSDVAESHGRHALTGDHNCSTGLVHETQHGNRYGNALQTGRYIKLSEAVVMYLLTEV